MTTQPETVFDILRTFNITKNVEEGMTQTEWIKFIDELEWCLQ